MGDVGIGVGTWVDESMGGSGLDVGAVVSTGSSTLKSCWSTTTATTPTRAAIAAITAHAFH